MSACITLRYLCHTCDPYGTLDFTDPDILTFFPQKVLSEILKDWIAPPEKVFSSSLGKPLTQAFIL